MGLEKIPDYQGNATAFPSMRYLPGAAAANTVVRDAPCVLHEIWVSNPGSSLIYALIFDASSAPADTTAVHFPFIAVDAGANETIAFPYPIPLSTGCVISSSSTAATKTSSGTLLVYATIS